MAKISSTISSDYLISGLMKDDEDNPIILPLQEVINLSRDTLLLMHKAKEPHLANPLFTEAAALVKTATFIQKKSSQVFPMFDNAMAKRDNEIERLENPINVLLSANTDPKGAII